MRAFESIEPQLLNESFVDRMRHLRNQDDYWKPCRPGAIYQATDTKFQRQRRKFFVQLAMGGAIAVTGLFSGFFVLRKKNLARSLADNDMSMNTNGQIKLTCDDIERLTPDYVKAIRRDVEQRSEDQKMLIADFDQHLGVCQNCPTMILKAVNQV